MSQPRIIGDSDNPAVIAWDDEPRDAHWSRIVRGILAKHRRVLALVVAVLGSAAVFASFVGEWQTTTLPGDPFAAPGAVQINVAGLAGWSPAYLIGVFALTSCLALVLFGPPPARAHIRLAGLAIGGVLLAILAAITIDLGEDSVAVVFPDPNMHYELAYGQGLFAAFAGVAGYLIALVLAVQPVPADGKDDIRSDAARHDHPRDDIDWPWRRPGKAYERDEPEPLDLTVGPAEPITFSDPDGR